MEDIFHRMENIDDGECNTNLVFDGVDQCNVVVRTEIARIFDTAMHVEVVDLQANPTKTLLLFAASYALKERDDLAS
ncbi:hypothetical protein GcM1_035001, partial [Golovinomyces cichoracearum]